MLKTSDFARVFDVGLAVYSRKHVALSSLRGWIARVLRGLGAKTSDFARVFEVALAFYSRKHVLFQASRAGLHVFYEG